MGPLKWFLTALALLAAPLAAAPIAPTSMSVPSPIARWRPFIVEASARFGVPQPWIERVMAIESGGRATRDGRPIRSAKGAIGLMQLMPATWSAMRDANGLGPDPDDPRDNILAGTAYLRLMYDRFGYPGLFGAYNAGPARYAAYLAGAPLPAETRGYLIAIGDAGLATSRPAPRSGRLAAPPPTLFIPLAGPAVAPTPAAPATPDGLFVELVRDRSFSRADAPGN